MKGKKIVITGASSGIGEQLALEVAELGATPILLARNGERLRAVSENIKQKTNVYAPYFILDVTVEEDVKRTFNLIYSDFGSIDILVNNAGFGFFADFHMADFKVIKEMFDVNVFGVIACTQSVLPYMMKQDAGHIINVASQAAKIATPKSSAYSATKHAVLGLSNSLRLELMDTNIFVSTVNPGPIKTRFFDTADQTGEYVKKVEKYMLDPKYVAKEIVKLIMRPKRELNLPKWMNLGSTLYQVMPQLVERLAKKAFKLK